MINLTKILLESLYLIESIEGERLFDSLCHSYSSNRGGGGFMSELKGLSDVDLKAVVDFAKSIGYNFTNEQSRSVLIKEITDAVAADSVSSSSSSSYSNRANEIDDDDDELENEPPTRQRPSADDEGASERHLASLLMKRRGASIDGGDDD